jgi:hypothetical protein
VGKRIEPAAKGTVRCQACGKRRDTAMVRYFRRAGGHGHRDPICLGCLAAASGVAYSPLIQSAIRAYAESEG